jgi:hypothetical protein
MKRSMCGLVVLALATSVWSCNGDPTGDIRGNPRIVANPSSVFVDNGASKFVVVHLVDEQGNQLAANFEPQNVGAGVTVVRDTTYLQTTIGTTLETSQRFIVTGTTPTASSFQISASGAEPITIPVNVKPTGLSVTLSNPTPAMNEPVVITLPAGYKFGAEPGANVAGEAGIVTAVAPDSSSVTVVFPPGTSGPVTVEGVEADFLPGVPFDLDAAETVTVPSAPLPGTESPTTAPVMPLPPVGGLTVLFDVPDFTATVDHFYRIDVVEPGDYTITVDWDIGSDIDAPVCLSDPTCASEDFVDPTVSASHPETGTFTLPAGTHVIWVNDYGADAAGATISIVIERE